MFLLKLNSVLYTHTLRITVVTVTLEECRLIDSICYKLNVWLPLIEGDSLFLLCFKHLNWWGIEGKTWKSILFYLSLWKKTDVKSESQTQKFNPLARRKKNRLGFPICSSTQIIQSKDSLADVGRKHPSRRQRRRMVRRDDMFKVASRHHGSRANNKLCDVLQDFCKHRQVVRRIRDCLCHASSGSQSNHTYYF